MIIRCVCSCRVNCIAYDQQQSLLSIKKWGEVPYGPILHFAVLCLIWRLLGVRFESCRATEAGAEDLLCSVSRRHWASCRAALLVQSVSSPSQWRHALQDALPGGCRPTAVQTITGRTQPKYRPDRSAEAMDMDSVHQANYIIFKRYTRLIYSSPNKSSNKLNKEN